MLTFLNTPEKHLLCSEVELHLLREHGLLFLFICLLSLLLHYTN